ncbi:hypothetical protein C8J31_11426 [Rhizobium sp. PP-CC-2G-626]|nr:hypothetical protein C8J31_11426 [Rhizobium sp. PP-CC-2G-626]
MSLLELVRPTAKIVARIETDPGKGRGSAGGAIIVAYPAEDGSKEPREACLLQGDWLYPASLDSPETSNRVLQLRVNTGGSDATIVQVSDGLASGQPKSCERAESENGLFNRVCRLPLTAASNGVAQVRLTVRQRNANPIRKVFNVVVSETKQ